MRALFHGGVLTAAVVAFLNAGCVVPQPPGKGSLKLLRENTTKRHYWLYRPEEYMAQLKQGIKGPVHPTTKNGKWPLVVSFHGMKPFDNCLPQAQEWQQESDRYGFVMIAPQLNTSDLLMEFPLRSADRFYVKEDERTSLAVIREVTTRLPGTDRQHILSTSWSSGGYMAHFMVNRHPELFSCLAVRQSNFSDGMLDPRQIRKYRTMPIGIFWTQNDFAICQSESRKAVAWYRRQGFRDLSWGVFGGMGHERTPQSAAALFAIQCKIRPRSPARFATLVESYGRLRAAVSYAQRPAARLAIPLSSRQPRAGIEAPSRSSPLARSGNPKRTHATTPSAPKPVKVADATRAPSPSSPSRATNQPPRNARRTRSERSLARPQTPRKTTPAASERRKAWEERSTRTGAGSDVNANAPYTQARLSPPKAVTPTRNLTGRSDRAASAPPIVTPRRPRREATAAAKSEPVGKFRNPAPVAPDAARPALEAPARVGTGRTQGVPPPVRRKASSASEMGNGKPTARKANSRHATGQQVPSGKPPVKRARTPAPGPAVAALPKPPERTNVPRRPNAQPVRRSGHRPSPSAGSSHGAAARMNPSSPRRSNAGSVQIQISPTIGRGPMFVRFKAVLPRSVAKGADFLWTDNGVPLCNGQTSDKVLYTPGKHRIEVLVITADERELRGGGTVQVLGKTNDRKRPAHSYGTYK